MRLACKGTALWGTCSFMVNHKGFDQQTLLPCLSRTSCVCACNTCKIHLSYCLQERSFLFSFIQLLRNYPATKRSEVCRVLNGMLSVIKLVAAQYVLDGPSAPGCCMNRNCMNEKAAAAHPKLVISTKTKHHMVSIEFCDQGAGIRCSCCGAHVVPRTNSKARMFLNAV
jgi:hypothetical protein